MIEATVIEYKTKRRKQATIEIMNVLIEQEDKGSRIEEIPFLYTCFPAMIYYNKTVLIGQRINIDYENNSSKEAIARLVPWEEQGLHIKEKIYSLFFEAMSELYFSKDQNIKFKKEFERYRRRRLKEKHQLQSSQQLYCKEKSIVDEATKKLRRSSIQKNKELLERLFRLDSEEGA